MEISLDSHSRELLQRAVTALEQISMPMMLSGGPQTFEAEQVSTETPYDRLIELVATGYHIQIGPTPAGEYYIKILPFEGARPSQFDAETVDSAINRTHKDRFKVLFAKKGAEVTRDQPPA
jgi:hypothetical protein